MTQSAYRLLPKVDTILALPEVEALCGQVPRDLVTSFVGDVIGEYRREIAAGVLDADQLSDRLAAGDLVARIERLVSEELGRGVVPAINATGVVMHTGLGRSPVHPEAAAAMEAAARGYCVLEVDRFSGARNQRDDRLSELMRRLTGAEAGIAVNNNAAAAFLTMHTFATGREAIVSRGELVEIGGSFRVPDVMKSAGVRLVEVGATNRTRIGDYERAITPDTGLLMKVHTSNFKQVGFTEEVEGDELAQLGRERGIPTAFDLGSGRLEAPGARPLAMLGGETLVREAVESGLEVVSFSGDKLIGGPQAGLIVGTTERINAMRRNPIYRAMRLDKAMLAGLEVTLELLLAGRGDEVPTRAMLLATSDEVRERAMELSASLGALNGVECEVVRSQAEPGSGSAPGEYLDSAALRVTVSGRSADELGNSLRAGEPPVFTRIQDGAVLLDPRTLLPGDSERLVAAFQSLLHD